MEFGTATLSGYLGSSKYRYHIRSYNPASDTEDVERSTSGDYQFLTAAGELSYEGAYNCVLYLTDDTSFTTSTRYRPNLAGTFSMNHHSFNMNSGGIITGGARDTSDTIDRLKFTCASGNFVLGRWTIYGIKHA